MTDKDAATGRGAALIEAEAASEKLRFTGLPRIIIVAFTLFAIALTVNQLFNLKLTGSAILDGVYLNLLAGIFLCLAFLTFRARAPHTATVPWYDWILFAAAVATGTGMVPIRKAGKLPRPAASVSYALEYGEAAVEASDDIPAGSRVLVLDDVLATGGTLRASHRLLAELGAQVIGSAVLLELESLGGRAVAGDVHTVFTA